MEDFLREITEEAPYPAFPLTVENVRILIDMERSEITNEDISDEVIEQFLKG